MRSPSLVLSWIFQTEIFGQGEETRIRLSTITVIGSIMFDTFGEQIRDFLTQLLYHQVTWPGGGSQDETNEFSGA